MDQDDIYFAAMLARDPRFDGKFFIGVKTTGIYCRPVCPAKPKRKNVEFFKSHHEAEKAGYRPCLRCRPESAPQTPVWIGTSAIVQRAARLLHSQEALELDEERFANRFGVSARHLRRLFIDELGKTPKQIAFESRLNLARKLIVESKLAISEVALASGFGSIRRFNDAFRDRFKKSPSEIRRNPLQVEQGLIERGLMMSLAYRPPYDFAGLLAHYSAHRMGALEWVQDGAYHRIVTRGIVTRKAPTGAMQVALLRVADDPKNSRLLLSIELSEGFSEWGEQGEPRPALEIIPAIVTRVREMFDVDSDPVLVANSLENDAQTAKLLGQYPGIRLPSGWDPFEMAIATILGQLVSVDRGRALVSDLIEMLGQEIVLRSGNRVKLFPEPHQIASADLSSLKTTSARKKTLQAFSQAVASGELSLEPTQDVDDFIERVQKLPGVGPWTASYMALKCLRHTDAFPATDLVLAKVIQEMPKETLEKMSPWRGYAAALYWRDYGSAKKNTVKPPAKTRRKK